MAYQEGDTSPPHINVHNEVVSKLADISAEYDLDLVLPPQRSIGDTEHVKDHNLITDALQAIDDWEAAGGGAPGAAVIGGATGAVTQSSFTGDGTNGDLGQAYDVYEFLGSGTLDVSEPGIADVLVVGGGQSGLGADNSTSNQYGGNAQAANLISSYIQKPSYTVQVGAGGAGGAQAGDKVGETSGIEALSCSGGSNAPYLFTGFGRGTTRGGGGGAGSPGDGQNGGSGIASYITGSETFYAGGGGGTNGNGGAGGGGKGAVGTGSGSNGDANTGGGGGGAGTSAGVGSKYRGAGGSGIVIVRVKVPSESYPFRTRSTAPRTAHAARIEDGIVRQVIVIPHLDDDDAKITEYCNRIGLPGTWVDTSYTGARRGKYAGVGDTFVSTKAGGEFISPVTEEISTADLPGEEQ